MKILYVSASSIPSRTANSIHVMKMCQAFHDDGHEVVLLAPRTATGGSEEMRDLTGQYGIKGGFSLRRYRAFRGPGRSILNSISILRAFRDAKPDLVYGRFAPACAAACLAGYQVAFEAHSPLWKEGAASRASLFLMKRSSRFRGLVVISQALRRMCLENVAIGESKVLVAHDGADESAATATLVPGMDGRLQAGYFGHLYKGRGIELILGAAERLPDVDFHVYGGTEDDIGYWKGRAKSENLFFHGFVEPGLVPGYRSGCDVLLAPYQKKVAVSGADGDTSAYMSPLKIFEYMSGRRAMIVSDLPVLREVLGDDMALLVDPEDLSQWVDALEKLRDTSLRERLAGTAYSEFLLHYTWKGRARKLLEGLGFAGAVS